MQSLLMPLFCRTQRPTAPLSATFQHLAQCQKTTLGLPIVNPGAFLAQCQQNETAAFLTVGKPVLSQYGQEEMQALLAQGEYMDTDGPLLVSTVWQEPRRTELTLTWLWVGAQTWLQGHRQLEHNLVIPCRVRAHK